MAILTILEFPDPKLRTVAQSVQNIDNSIRTLIEDMFETMYNAPGVGLAATQVNVHKRVVVMDTTEDSSEPLVFINPKVEILDEELYDYEEGCLSVPGFYEEITRPRHVRVTALNKEGKEFTMEPEGLLAVCIQHELDHLDGKLFVDYVSSMKRSRIRKKLEKQHKAAAKQ